MSHRMKKTPNTPVTKPAPPAAAKTTAGSASVRNNTPAKQTSNGWFALQMLALDVVPFHLVDGRTIRDDLDEVAGLITGEMKTFTPNYWLPEDAETRETLEVEAGNVPPASTHLRGNIAVVLRALGSAYRDNWGEYDPETYQWQLEDIAKVLSEGEENFDPWVYLEEYVEVCTSCFVWRSDCSC